MMRARSVALVFLLLLASVADAGQRVTDLAGLARAEARRWKGDAVLMEVSVQAGADGTLDWRATPQHSATFTFLSPSTGQALMVSVVGGRAHPMPGPTGATVALPDRFADLSEAVAQARPRGLRGPVISASLRAQPNGRLAWTVTASDPATATASGPIVVDAGGGTAAAQGRAAAQAVTQQQVVQSQGATRGGRGDFATVRRKADALAATQDRAFQLVQVDLAPYGAGLPDLWQGYFHYFRGLRQGREWLLIYAPGGGGDLEISVRRNQEGPLPAGAPENVPGPFELLRRTNHPLPLRQDAPNPPESMTWLLFRGGVVPERSPHTAGFDLGNTAAQRFLVESAPRGRWVWWTVLRRRKLVQKPSPAETLDEFFYLDSVSGQVTSRCAYTRPNEAPRPEPCPPSAPPPPRCRTC